MIKIKKVDVTYCNCCGMKNVDDTKPVENVYDINFSAKNSNMISSSILLCKTHLLELRDLIDKEIKNE